MNIQELVLKDMPDNLNDLEKARYIYIKLGLLLNFSTKFNNTSDEMSIKMYNMSNIDITNLPSNQVICTTWSIIYSKLLDIVGVENKIIKQGHKSVGFKYNDQIWIADATGGNYIDLSRIKYGDETARFGLAYYQDEIVDDAWINYTPESIKLIRSIDKKLNLNIDKKNSLIEFKKFIDKIKSGELLTEVESYSTSPILTKLEMFFAKVGVLSDGYYEAKDFVFEFEDEILTREELKNVKSVELKRTNKDYEVDIIQCISVYENEEYSYYLLAPNLSICKVPKEKIIALSALGYSTEKDIPGIRPLRRFVPGKISKKGIKYILVKLTKYEEIKMYDEPQIHGGIK